MIVTMHVDWFGDGIKGYDDDWKKACDTTDGVKFMGRYVSHQAKYHYTYFFEVDSYDKLMEAMGKLGTARDRNVMTHASLEIFSGPQ